MSQLSTVSVRARVTLAVLVVLAVVLLVLSLAVNALFVAQSERNLDALLNGRAQLARQLARAGVGPQQIVNRVSAEGVQAALTMRNGLVLGTPPISGSEVRSVTTQLNGVGRENGATLTLSVATSVVVGAQRTLRRLLLVAAVVALLVSAALVTVMVRVALRPLDAVAALARGITEGRRGSRLRPSRTDTEIGKTAQALDEMLDELEGAEARAQQAEERTRRFLADAAHELRTPVAGMSAAAETLLHSGEQLDVQQREQLEVLLIREGRRSGTLVSDLLAAARLDAGVSLERVAVSLAALVEAEVERARLLSPDARVAWSGADVVLSADPDKLAGILRNLVENALRASGPTGRVELCVRSTEDTAEVDVLDSGPGVAPSDRELIFDRLVRLDAHRAQGSGGSGLGLAISRGWARAHGGDVVCLDPPIGWGARFRLTFPRTAPAAG
jgi:two-component system OmpR family sensor kinase